MRISGPDVINLGSDIKVAVLICSADSRPTSQYQWFTDSVSAAKDGPVLTVIGTTPQVINNKCKAYNNVTEISVFQNKTLTISE